MHNPNRRNLDPKSSKCLFLGFSEEHTGFWTSNQRNWLSQRTCVSIKRIFEQKSDVQDSEDESDDETVDESHDDVQAVDILEEDTQYDSADDIVGDQSDEEITKSGTSEKASKLLEDIDNHRNDYGYPKVMDDTPTPLENRRSTFRETPRNLDTPKTKLSLTPYLNRARTPIYESPPIAERTRSKETPRNSTFKTGHSDTLTNVKTYSPGYYDNLRWSNRGPQPKSHDPIEGDANSSDTLEVCYAFMATEGVPKNVQEALSMPIWKAAMTKELDSLKSLKSWELVDIPPGKKVVGCRWVYAEMFDSNGNRIRAKARLVAQGFSQVKDIDFSNTFAPVVKFTTLRIVFAIVSRLG